MAHRTPSSPISTRRRDATRLLTRAADQNGMTLLVDGLAGMGKSRILSEVAAGAQESGQWSVMYTTADEVESGEPYSFIERLLAAGLAPGAEFTPDARTQPIPVAKTCVHHLLHSAGRERLLIVIDDGQWMDAESVRVLRYLIPRITRRGILMACGVRSPHLPDSIGQFLQELTAANPLDAHYHIDPLTGEQIQALAVERFGRGIPMRDAQRLRNATGGSFLGIDAILAQLTSAEVSQLHLAWNIPIRIGQGQHNPLLHRYLGLSPKARATADLVCMAGHELSHAALTAATEIMGEAVTLHEPMAAEVIAESGFGSSLIPGHDLIAHAVRDAMPAARARRISQALAAVTDGYRSVQHALRGAEHFSDDLHAQLKDYVADAVHHGGYINAHTVLRAALQLPQEEAVRHDLLIELALVNLRDNSGYLLMDLLDEFEALPPSLLREFIVIMVGAHRVGEPFPMERVLAMLTPRTDPDERTIQAFLAFMLVIMTMRTADPSPVPGLIDQARGFFAQAPSDPAAVADPRLAWMVAPAEFLLLLDAYDMVHAQRQYRQDEAAAALADLYERLPAMHDGPQKVDVLVAIAGAEVAFGSIPRAHAVAEQAAELTDRVSKPWAAGTVRLILAHCLVLLGELTQAADLLDVIESQSFDVLDVESRPQSAALRAILAATRGAEPAPYLEQARVIDEIEWEGYAPDLAVMAECEAARAAGDPDAVLAATTPERVGTLVNTQHGFLTYRAHALLTLDQVDAAEGLIEQLAGWRGQRWQETWGSLAWLYARLAQARGQHQRAHEFYLEAGKERTYPLPAALTFADHGSLHIARGDTSAARRSLQSAQAILQRIDAAGYLRPVSAALESLAEAEQLTHRRLLAELTRREREIADHLGDGRSNQQIAQRLVVSEATVRFHVSNILAKLQIGSRAEVARILHGPG